MTAVFTFEVTADGPEASLEDVLPAARRLLEGTRFGPEAQWEFTQVRVLAPEAVTAPVPEAVTAALASLCEVLAAVVAGTCANQEYARAVTAALASHAWSVGEKFGDLARTVPDCRQAAGEARKLVATAAALPGPRFGPVPQR
jgi:hypothetical protein